MSAISKIQWTDRTWNPVRGCSIVSPGCVNCYAMKQAHRFSGEGRAYHGLTKQTKAGPQWTGTIRTVESALLEPLSWRQPARVFVNSMSDLFHEDVPAEFIDRVFAVMIQCRRHTFQILTKRPQRMRAYLIDAYPNVRWMGVANHYFGAKFPPDAFYAKPLPNVWLGVSCEDQQRADERIPWLLQTPAAVRFVSAEPLLGHIDLRRYLVGHEEHGTPLSDPPARTVGGCIGWTPPIDWVIVGGESGAGARFCQVEWIDSVVHQCRWADVACFVKQLGSRPASPSPTLHDWPRHAEWRGAGVGTGLGVVKLHSGKGGDPSEWPEELRVREFPQDRVTT